MSSTVIQQKGGVSNVDIDGNNAFQIKAIGVVISTFETLPGKDLRLETYAHIPTDRADQYVPEKRHEFFATWAYQRAKALGLDGVIVLICKDPAFLQVEVGERTKQRAFTLANRDHLRDLLVTAFRQRHFDDGLRQ